MNAKKIFKFINYFFSFVGLSFLIFLLLMLFYGESAKQRRKLIYNTINSFAGIGSKYDGFVANTPSKYFKVIYFNIKNKFTKFPYHSLNIEIDSENLDNLDTFRKNKYLGKTSKDKFVDAKIDIFNELNLETRDTVNVKLRPKGDRELHFLNLNTMSYKVDVKGKNKFRRSL